MNKIIPADQEKIRAIMKRNGLSLAEGSTKIGYADTYLSSIRCRGNKISIHAAMNLEHLFGVKPEAYAPDPVKVPELEPKPAPAELIPTDAICAELRAIHNALPSAEDLSALIYSAVYDAVKKALAE